MPRPGPRPYECVRRAWHSDRHQPIRGSLIQEIFRLANEVHGPRTRKNKEWQEKLPFVVLKAEEIMYSKANSEAEYMDLTTLLERANDAIDTIIRKDESTETGDLLKPCIEAALNLGCVPRKASRSQRNNSPRCYLSCGINEPVDTSALAPLVAPCGQSRSQNQGVSCLPLPVNHSGNTQSGTKKIVECCSSFGKPVAVNCGPLDPRSLALHQRYSSSVSVPQYEFPRPSVESSDQDRHLSSPSESCTWSTTARVYPLRYFENQRGTIPQLSLHSSSRLKCIDLSHNGSSDLPMTEGELDQPPLDSVPISHNKLPLLSVKTSTSNQDRDPCWQSSGHAYSLNHREDLQDNSNQPPTSINALSANTRKRNASFIHLAAGNVRCPISETSNPHNLDGTTPDFGCDLSLRLGPASVAFSDGENAWTPVVEDVCSNSFHGGNKFNMLDSSPSVNGIRC